jgi:nucleoid-associated protein YgaU
MRTVTVSGGDLYHLALQYLGDAQQWNRIAQANNLLDPVITGIVTLQIPDPNPLLTGGVLVR